MCDAWIVGHVPPAFSQPDLLPSRRRPERYQPICARRRVWSCHSSSRASTRPCRCDIGIQSCVGPSLSASNQSLGVFRPNRLCGPCPRQGRRRLKQIPRSISLACAPPENLGALHRGARMNFELSMLTFGHRSTEANTSTDDGPLSSRRFINRKNQSLMLFAGSVAQFHSKWIFSFHEFPGQHWVSSHWVWLRIAMSPKKRRKSLSRKAFFDFGYG